MPTVFAPKKQDPSVREMIERYLASGGTVKPIPATDSRILPRKRYLNWDKIDPKSDGETVYQASRSAKPRPPAAYENWPPMESVVRRVGECQSAPESSRARRFEILAVGLTLGQLRDKGLRLSDLTRYLGSGVLEIEAPGVPASDSPGLSEHQEDSVGDGGALA